jgi:Sigma-70 region 2
VIATAGTEASDCKLVGAVRDGNDSAFEELYRRYHSRIAGFVRSMLHDEARAEDLAQEAFLSALRRMRATDVESALFRARRRLEAEYEEIADGRRCNAMRATLARMVDGTHGAAEEHRLARHVKRCHGCRHRARVLGIQPQTAIGTLRQKVAALLPIPWLFKRSGGDGGGITGLLSTGANAAPLIERAAALVAAVALVGAGGAALEGGALRGDRATAGEDRHAVEYSAPVRGESQRGTAGPATDGERAGARRASGRRTSGQAGGRAGGSDRSRDSRTGGSTTTQSPSGGSDSGSSTGGLPALPNTSAPSTGSAPRVQLQAPELPTVSPPQGGQVVPEVQVPETGVPVVDDTTGAVQDVTGGGVQDSLPNLP